MELRRRRFGRAVRLEVRARHVAATCSTLLLRELDLERDDVSFHRAPLDLNGLFLVHATDRPDLKDDAVAAGLAGAAGGGQGRRARHLLGDPRGRRARAPPLRVLRHLGRGVRPPGRRRPACPHDQDDALPHVGRQPHRAQPHPGRRAGRAGGGPRRAEGPLRRGGQHQLGEGAGARRRPRGLRPGRVEDPLEDAAGDPQRGRRHPPLRPHRHRATTTRRRRGSTRTSACCRAMPSSAPTSRSCSTTSPATAARTATARSWWRRTTCATASRT